jgi:methylmalonyl-CoA epimerase
MNQTTPINRHLKSIYKRVDHLAIAVEDLEQAIDHYSNVMGMPLLERRETVGEKTGMLSAVMDAGNFTIVLIQGLQASSQVSRYVNHFGQGVQHMAFEVDNIGEVVKTLSAQGVAFSTDLLIGPGLTQIFTKRDKTSGMMYEFIERTGEEGFQESNINNLFAQLESHDNY